MSYQNRIKIQELSSFNAASLTANYQEINSTGFPEPILILRIVNASDADITLSFDGSTDQEFIPGTTAAIPRGVLQLDFTSTPSTTGYPYLAKGSKVYVKGTAGTGTIYMSAYSQGEN